MTNKIITFTEVMQWIQRSSLVAGIVLVALFSVYVVSEPVITHSQATDQFTISQSVTAEISFVTPTSDVTMSPSIPGITGGTANGSAQVRVYTNNNTGFNMTIQASSSPAMQGNVFGGSIRDFATTTSGWMAEPAYDFTVPANSAGFGYNIQATSSTDLDQSFLNNGSICNAGSSQTSGQCWIGASTTAFTIINRSTQTAASGATSTIYFRTTINSTPSPAIPEDTYVATTTLTATVN